MNFEQDFKRQFGDKYQNLNLRSVVVKKNEASLVVTFLYPSTDAELSIEQKNEIIDWLKEQLSLEKLSLKVKFMRVFVESRLITKSVLEFFEKKYKLVSTYMSEKNLKIEIRPLDVCVSIELSPRLQILFKEHDIAGELAKYLKSNFLVEFTIVPVENSALVDEVDIENVQMKATYQVVKRYSVEILKTVAGTPIVKGLKEEKEKSKEKQAEEEKILKEETNSDDNSKEEKENLEDTGVDEKIIKDKVVYPEFVSNIRTEKTNVTIAGFIRKIERKEFVIKKGKRIGEQKSFYNISLQDIKNGRFDAIYFCPKTYERNMDALEENMFVAMHGDVRTNQLGKLQLYVDKIALANPIKQTQEKSDKPKIDEYGRVVQIEKITALEQNSMFERKNKYNNKIMGKTIVVFDLETTGLDREKSQITEIGAVKIENGNIVEKFWSFVKPTIPIPYDVSEKTGITNDMVADAPPVELVIRDFYEFTRGCVLSGHNVLDFDIHFIRREASLLGLDFDNDIIDTLNEARVARLKISHFNLGTVTKVLGISLEGAHRAWNDAYATAQVLLRLNEV